MSPSKDQNIETDLDISNSKTGVWLVKVPKYIAKKMEKASIASEIGKLYISKVPKGKAQVSMVLSDNLLNIEPNEKIPKEHILQTTSFNKQKLGIFSETKTKEESATLTDTKLRMEGTVVQKFDCRTVADDTYMQLKLQSIKNAAAPQKVVQTLDKVVHNFKPVKEHIHNIESKERRKAGGRKQRGDKNSVLDTLFRAFEKHQYYNIRDLVRITNQPFNFLKECLRDICDYNTRNPHKNMWELKKQYRYYPTDKH